MAKVSKSPFPGMDPYLERHWRDVHTALITYTRDQLMEYLPSNLLARMEERVYVEADGIPTRAIMPDVKVIEDPVALAGSSESDSSIAVADPVVLKLESEPVTEP